MELLQIVFFFEDWWAVALNIPKAFDRVWHAGLPHKLKSYRISGKIFDLISSFLSNRRRWVVLDGKSSQEYPVNAGVPQGSILVPALFLLCINDLMMMSVILLSMRMILLSILTWSVIWQNWLLNLNLTYQTLWTEAGSGFLISMLKKLNSFDQCNNTGAVDVKMDESVRKNHLLRYWVWLCLLNSIMAFILSLNFKCLQGSWFILWSFFFLRLLCVSINLLYSHAWNIVVVSGLVLLAATWFLDKLQTADMWDCWSFTCWLSWALGSLSKCSQYKSFL